MNISSKRKRKYKIKGESLILLIGSVYTGLNGVLYRAIKNNYLVSLDAEFKDIKNPKKGHYQQMYSTTTQI